MKRHILLLLLCFISALNGFTLSPPQYTLQRQLFHSVGASSCVKVSDVVEEMGTWYIDVTGCDAEVSRGLAFILTPSYNFGGIQVEIRVFDEKGNRYSQEIQLNQNPLDTVKTHYQNAFRENPYFKGFLQSEGGMGIPFVWLEFQPSVIQYFNDNISDFYGNDNQVAAFVFRDVCQTEFFDETTGETVPVSFSTAPKQEGSHVRLFHQYK